jgi:type IV secretory pathway TraG/TraD family ATPase VirD4
LYLVVPPSDKDRLRPLIRLMINQIVRGLTEKMEFKDGRSIVGYQHRLLLMLDEFPSLGKLDVFQESLAFIAGYGLKAYLIIQDISQLWTAYGKDDSIFSNCHVRVAYAPNKVETAELLSKMSGTATIVKRSFSRSGGLLGSKANITRLHARDAAAVADGRRGHALARRAQGSARQCRRARRHVDFYGGTDADLRQADPVFYRPDLLCSGQGAGT